MSEFKVKIEFKIEEETIKNLLTSALEGGSNYWYYLPDLSMCAPSDGKTPTVTRIWNAIKEGKRVPVQDYESGEHLGYISWEGIKHGIGIMADDKDMKHHLLAAIEQQDDAETGDVFLQYVVMGELVYA